MNQITKDQHVVPQRHLKNFLIPGQAKLECFNIDNLRIEKPRSPKSICVGEFHYALKPGEYDDYSQIVEKAFGDIEDWYGKNIERIETLLISGKRLSDQDRYGVSWVIANFYFRGHQHREQIKSMSLEVTEWAFPGDAKKKEIAEHTSYATNTSFDAGHANTLTHKHWRILLNHSTENPFITSDEAVIEILNSQIPEQFKFRGSFLHQTQIFHLSPRVAIITSFPFTKEMEGVMEFIDVSENEKGIAGNNLQYINFAHEYAYAPNKKLFNEVISYNKKQE